MAGMKDWNEMRPKTEASKEKGVWKSAEGLS